MFIFLFLFHSCLERSGNPSSRRRCFLLLFLLIFPFFFLHSFTHSSFSRFLDLSLIFCHLVLLRYLSLCLLLFIPFNNSFVYFLFSFLLPLSLLILSSRPSHSGIQHYFYWRHYYTYYLLFFYWLLFYSYLCYLLSFSLIQ